MPVTPPADDEETKVITITTPKVEEPPRAPTMRELEATHATLTFMQQPDNLHDEVKQLCCNGKHEENGHEAAEDRIAALKRRIKGGSKLRLGKKKRKN